MRLIRSIEINYFRSIYQFRLQNLNDLNVFVGGNDSGKSNVLRALNLFFNNSISDDTKLDFLQDVTHSRQAEARDAKGRLTIWVRVTFNNIEKWQSLPSYFSVKKVWNRYSADPEVSYDVDYTNHLQRFLNKIQYIYVPAVKDNNTYSKYLRRLYETIAESQSIDLVSPAASLSGSVNAAILTMSEKIAAATGVSSTINVPSDFRDLFERLSFSTLQDDFAVPLKNRGDGLQARHIPHIVEFICEQNKKYNIWGYEEPENSLEMTRSFEVARQFESEFSSKNQIFLTSHSAAFYGLSGPTTSKFYVAKTPHGDGSLVSSIQKLSDIKRADEALGIAHIIADRSKAIFEEIETLKHNLREARKYARPLIITEGPTDCLIFNEAVKRTGRSGDDYHVMCCERQKSEGGGADPLRKTLENIPADEPNLRFGIFDRDGEGVGAFEKLKKFKAYDANPDLKQSSSGRVFAILLPSVDWGDPYFAISGRQIAIEQLFDQHVVADLIDYQFGTAGGAISRHQADQLIATTEPQLAAKLVDVKIKIRNKAEAAKRICRLPDEKFQSVISLIKLIVKSQKVTRTDSQV